MSANQPSQRSASLSGSSGVPDCQGCDGTGTDPYEYGAPCPVCQGHGRATPPPTTAPAIPKPERQLILLHGPPGTGKTRALSEHTASAADKYGADRVCIVSLTRTAATEIAARVALPKENVGTLHAHCYRALEFPQLAETPQGLAAWNSRHPERHMGKTHHVEDAPSTDTDTGSDTDRIHAQVQGLRQRRTPESDWTVEQRQHHQDWTAFKTDTQRLDFTDLVERSIDESWHPLRPKVLLVDEAQDLSVLELELIARWARTADLTIVAGDTRQALYTWRGSDPEALLDLPYTSEQVLEQSWRIPAAVHQAATHWIAQLAERRPVTYHPTEKAGYLHRTNRSLREPHGLAHLITSTLDRNPEDTVMVLTACGYMLTPTLHQLKSRAVPFHNPRRPDHHPWNPLKAADRLRAFLRPDATIWPKGESRSWTWGDLQDWTDMVKSQGNLPRGLKTTIEAEVIGDPRNRFDDDNAGRDIEIPPEQVGELLGSPLLMNHPALRLDTTWLRGALLPKYEQQLAYTFAVLDTHGRQALTTPPRLIVGTIHSCKGAEADHLILAPDLSRAGAAAWEQGDRDSIIRTFYVALTRARKTVTILDPSGPEHVDPQDLAGGHVQVVAA